MFKRMSELGSTRNNDPLELFGGVGTKPAHVNIVAIFLYEAKGLPAMDRNGLSDFFCKFKLGEEKYKTKVIQETLHPRWNEQFDLFVYDVEERNLEISVWDWDRAARNDFVGDTVLDLSTLENEKLHDLWLEVHKNGLSCGSLHFTVMITGKKISSGEETDADADALQAELSPDIADRYSLLDSWKHVRDVGTLSVKLFKGTGLRAADLNGKSDPFCILQLANTRFHTQVEPKTLEPEWNRVFTFPVSDIHTALDITVMDMDLDKKSDFLGRVAIPLLKIHNKERRWYVLKDQKLQARTQGSILLEVELVYNPVRAAIRTLCEKDSSMDGASSKFDRRIFIRNVGRIRGALVPFLDWANCFQSCLSWESKQRSVTALIAYLFLVWFCEPWMVPVWFLFVFLLSYAKRQLLQDSHLHGENSEYEDDEWHFENETDLDHDPNGVGKANVVSQKTNFVAKVRRAQEQLANVQDVMGYGADLCERVQNTFRFVIPWLSYMGMSMLCVLAVILYVVPLRILLIIWGIAKFGKKLRNQHTHDSNELLDFFSRMHTNDEIRMYRELREFREKDYDHAGNGHAVNGKTDDHILKRTVSLQLHGSSVSHD